MTLAVSGRHRRFPLLFALLFLVLAGTTRAAKPVWEPLPPDLLVETEPKVEATAPAEVVLFRVEIDDREFPRARRTTTYLRYKIFEPDKTDEITRVTDVAISGTDDQTEIYARLIAPDGKIQEFGKSHIKERPLVQQAKQAGFFGWLAGSQTVARERFLAITGVERGAVLEYQFIRYDAFPPFISFTVAQREKLPVRWFEYRARVRNDDAVFNRTFISNKAPGANLVEDRKANQVIFTATNLPAIGLEPFGGAITDQVLTLFNCYEQSRLFLMPRTGKVPFPGTVEAAAGPWAPYATLMDWAARDRGVPTKRSGQLAAEITAMAQGDEEKAAAIHRWVEKQWRAKRERVATLELRRLPNSLDDVIDWEKQRDLVLGAEDFMWLALSLCRSAGLDAHAVLLPNREFAHFNPRTVSTVFLPNQAIAIRIGEAWRFSSPHHAFSLPFNLLPWQQEAQQGLLALPKKQEFITVPASPAERSVASLSGALELDDEGTVKGRIVRRFTGHLAAPVRSQLRLAPAGERLDLAKGKLGFELKAAELTVTEIGGLDDPEAPLEITCDLRWRDFATRTKDRMIIRALVHRAEAVTPFPAENRKRGMYFPFCWKEVDDLTLQLPPGYELESPSVPSAVPGEVLQYRLDFRYDRGKRALLLHREFKSGVVAVAVERYPAMRKFYDYVTRSDQHELLLRRQPAKGAAQ